MNRQYKTIPIMYFDVELNGHHILQTESAEEANTIISNIEYALAKGEQECKLNTADDTKNS